MKIQLQDGEIWKMEAASKVKIEKMCKNEHKLQIFAILPKVKI